jgi:transcriptional regulator
MKKDKTIKNGLRSKFLTPRERKIMSMRLGGRTLQEIGQEFGITRERVRQIERKIKRKLLMKEAKYYQIIKKKIEELFREKGINILLEITAEKGFTSELKRAIPETREIIFPFLGKKPDISGFVEKEYSKDFVIIEVKEEIKLDGIYQAKLYKEVFDARYTFLVSLMPIPEEIRRLCKSTYNILHSAQDSIYSFFVLTYFNKEINDFVDWFEENPFEKGTDSYWK